LGNYDRSIDDEFSARTQVQPKTLTGNVLVVCRLKRDDPAVALDQVATNTQRSVNDQRVKLNPFRVEDQADLLQDIKLLSKEENL